MNDDEMDRFLEFEGRFWKAVEEALSRHADHDGRMTCPICGEEMDAVRRGPRLTFAGWEDACIQVQCDICELGGEAANPDYPHPHPEANPKAQAAYVAKLKARP